MEKTYIINDKYIPKEIKEQLGMNAMNWLYDILSYNGMENNKHKFVLRKYYDRSPEVNEFVGACLNGDDIVSFSYVKYVEMNRWDVDCMVRTHSKLFECPIRWSKREVAVVGSDWKSYV